MAAREQLLLDLEREPALGREDFLPAPGNREALAWIDRWPDWPAPALVLHGPEGAGKTHLARIFAARSGGRQLAPGDLAPGAPPELPRTLVLDPALPVADEVALLQLYNRQRERGGHLLLTAREPAAHWPLALPDLASRLRAAPTVGLAAPDDGLLAAVLVKLFADRQIAVGDEVVGYLVRHMERSFAAARRLVAALDRHSLIQHKPVTVAMARRLLQESDPEQQT
jgi:chromosomal replication initiation ATPase DnaA